MTKTVRKKTARTIKKTYTSPFSIYWEKNNYMLLFAGAVLIIAGFYFMSLGAWDSFSSLVISPVLLFIGYLLVFPASIFYRKRSEKLKEETVPESNT
jgi:membrane protein YdbS with pleckstrin-like domain